MTQERALESERKQLIEAIEWVDLERRRHKGKDEDGFWLYSRRCKVRERLGVVNEVLKKLRMARAGRASEEFGMTFVKAAKERLAADVFGELVAVAERRCSEMGLAAEPVLAGEVASMSVLDGIRNDWKARTAVHKPERPVGVCGGDQGRQEGRREEQADFGIVRSGTEADNKGISRLEPLPTVQGRWNRELRRPSGHPRKAAYA
jgi:hypothetical protein